ncbi:DUF4124 domain-containing protein [Microbulbifer aggregans]|uniref:DUF4124 domain-containing protein n=1 Tax=Microbulbifer aggregans TaxID=1769779 RepID=UPI001CFE0810|nr:DUF4124 domain-containing protein [Microbulbifer aggregans]
MGKGFLYSLLIASSLSATAGELYRWVDAEGKVHFGDRPPAGTNVEEMESSLKPLNRADATKKQAFPDSRRADQVERDYQNQKRQQQQNRARQQQTACSQARRQLRVLQGPVYFVDDKGNESTISERQREQRARELAEQIRQLCG